MSGPGARAPILRRVQNRLACRRQLGSVGRLHGAWRRQADRWFGEPDVELLAAAVVGVVAGLRLALRVAGRAVHADMEVLVVAGPDHDLVQPGTIAGHGLAEPLLDPLVGEDAVDTGRG